MLCINDMIMVIFVIILLYCNLGWLDNKNFYKFLLGLKKE